MQVARRRCAKAADEGDFMWTGIRGETRRAQGRGRDNALRVALSCDDDSWAGRAGHFGRCVQGEMDGCQWTDQFSLVGRAYGSSRPVALTTRGVMARLMRARGVAGAADAALRVAGLRRRLPNAVRAMLVRRVNEPAEVWLNAQYVEVVPADFIDPDAGWILAGVQRCRSDVTENVSYIPEARGTTLPRG